MAVVTMPKVIHSQNGNTKYMLRSLIYVGNSDKTTDQESGIEYRLVAGLNCSDNEFETYDEMISVRNVFGAMPKGAERLMYHYVQSFVPGETTPEQAFALGLEFCERAFDGQYQIYIGTHTDRGHIHNHILLHNINIESGHKYHADGAELPRLRMINDELCKEYGLDTIEPDEKAPYRYRDYAEWAELNGTGHSMSSGNQIRADVETMLAASVSLSQFKYYMETKYGYQVKLQNEHVSIKPPDGKRFYRLDTLFRDESYKPKSLEQRLYDNRNVVIKHKSTPGLKNPKMPVVSHISREWQPKKTAASFIAYTMAPWYIRVIVYNIHKIRRLKRQSSYANPYMSEYQRKQIDLEIQKTISHYEFLKAQRTEFEQIGDVADFLFLKKNEITDLIAERKRIYRKIQRTDKSDKQTLAELEKRRDQLTEKIQSTRSLIKKVETIEKEKARDEEIQRAKEQNNVKNEERTDF